MIAGRRFLRLGQARWLRKAGRTKQAGSKPKLPDTHSRTRYITSDA